MTRIKWPIALATLFVLMLGWYLYYTKTIVQQLRQDSEFITEIFDLVQQGIQGTQPDSEVRALSDLQSRILESGLPIIVADEDGRVIAAENLSFVVTLSTPEGQRRALDEVARLSLDHEPISGVGGNQIYFGDTPEIRRLRWIPLLQASGLLITVTIGFLVIRNQRRAEGEKAWTAMARELAHQLGTPISSLQGWLELIRVPEDDRPGKLAVGEVAAGIEEDLVRLEKISHRFELIGREPELESLDLREVVSELERYLQARIPRLRSGVLLVLDIPKNLPPVMGNDMLLTWALENVVKNALDALAGKGGEIRIMARQEASGWVSLRIQDTGPGVPYDLRDTLFDPGVSSKSSGWGVGLTLSRRIIEGVHNGRISLLDAAGGGALFNITLPSARH
jgi:signal transduction histidine kinase